MRKQIILKCPICNEFYSKDFSEYKRNLKYNRISYCSLRCTGKNQAASKIISKSSYNISQHANNRLDIYSPFRYYLKLMKTRFDKYENITLEDLHALWTKQNGICPYTKLSLKLSSHTKFPSHQPDVFNYASIDRIDSSKGYNKDNIEFVSLGINLLKNKFSKKQVLLFLQQIKE
jgi:hypothetical protein